MSSFSKQKSEEIIDEKQAILNLTKIIPVSQASTLNLKICPFFVIKESMKDIYKNFPIQFNINNSDPLGPFIESEVNKDGDSYRSPWSNTYFPPIDSNKLLPKELRELEQKLNELIKLYKKIYYNEDAISSAYITYSDDQISNGFTCTIYIKSNINNSPYLKDDSFLETTNIVLVKFVRERSDEPNKEKIKINYKTNTIFLFKLNLKGLDNCIYNGTKNCECKKSTYTTNYFDFEKHLKYIGTSIEENEGSLRLKLDKIYLEKNNFIIKEIRMKEGQEGGNSQINNLKSLCSDFEKYAAAKKLKSESLINDKKVK